MSDLQAKMKAKLDGGRFRFINEKLYTTGGQDSFKLFQQHPELFEVVRDPLSFSFCTSSESNKSLMT
jgi:ribosomal RNA-processing protein 8